MSFHSSHSQTNANTMSFNDDETYRHGRPNIIGSVSSEEWNPDGLMLCTEYLGFESYDMRISVKDLENKMMVENELVETKTIETVVEPERKREFPPQLSSLNGRGQRSFYLRPVRKDGRLELAMVIIDWPEIFHASREDGRLRLHLVNAYYDSQETVEYEDKAKGLDRPLMYFNNDNEGDNISRSDKEINEDNDFVSGHHQVVDLSMIHDDHDCRELKNKNCCKILANMIDEVNDHQHHHIHSYHNNNTNNIMHLRSWSYVKTR